jgi:hypothetical protein
MDWNVLNGRVARKLQRAINTTLGDHPLIVLSPDDPYRLLITRIRTVQFCLE